MVLKKQDYKFTPGLFHLIGIVPGYVCFIGIIQDKFT